MDVIYTYIKQVEKYPRYQRFFLACDGGLRFVGRRPKTRAAKPREKTPGALIYHARWTLTLPLICRSNRWSRDSFCVRGTRTQHLICVRCSVHYCVSCAINKGGFSRLHSSSSTQQIYSEETNGAHAHNRDRVPLRITTTTGSELQCTAQARLVNFVVVVSSTTPNNVESRGPAIHNLRRV